MLKAVSSLIGASVLSMWLATGTAHAIAYTFDVVSPSGGCSEACAANVSITPGAGTLTITLTDTQANPHSAGDLLSGLTISTNLGSLGTATLGSQAGGLITVASTTGPYTTSGGPPTHWGAGVSGATFVLETAGSFAVGGAPINMIIGPPNGSGNYTGVASVTDGHFSPYINGTGTFVIDDSLITAATVITGVNFLFGTTPDTSLSGTACVVGTPGCVSAIPEPSTLVLLGAGLLALGLLRRRNVARF